jgi:tetratricopeptide (TPR) repeat protein
METIAGMKTAIRITSLIYQDIMRVSSGMRLHNFVRLSALLTASATAVPCTHSVTEAMQLHGRKEYEASLQALADACRNSDWNATAYKLKGLNLGALGRGLEAAKALESAVDLAPQDADAWYLLGFARLRIFQYPEAVAALTNAVRLNADLADAWITLAIAHEWLQEPDQAERAYRRMLSRARIAHADRTRAHLALGKLLVYHGRYQEAVEPLSSALQALPESAEAMKYLARAWRGVGRQSDALPVLRQAVRLNPRDMELRYLLLRTCQSLNLESEAQAQMAAIDSLEKAGARP